MLPNADSFNELCEEDKLQLLNYIADSYKMVKRINKNHTAYGLKARFNRLTGPNKRHHITSQCFMEAMVKSGYRAVLVSPTGEPNWYFSPGSETA